MAAIVFIAAFLVRIYNIGLFSLNHDEATWTLRSLYNFDKFLGIPVACFHGYIQPFFSYLVFFSKMIFFSPEYMVRIPSAAIGAGTAALVYILGKAMYGKKAGFISSLLLCFLPWHVIQSRIGVSLILTPFFGCLIFYALFNSLRKQSSIWFIFCCIFLGVGSFYTYQNSLLFIPVFLAVLLWVRKDLYWLTRKNILLSILIFFVTAYPILYLYITGQLGQYFGKIYRMYYQDGPFKGAMVEFISKAFINFIGNIKESFKGIFFTKAFILYGQALHHPLLISWISLAVISFSIVVSLRRRKIQDKIILIWLGLGYMGALSGVRYHAARYIILILPVLLIFIGKFIADFFDYLPIGAGLFLILIGSEFGQLAEYYYTAPFDLEEQRYNSYGCKEAAQYLSHVPNIKDYSIYSDTLMEPLDIYIDYYLYKKINTHDKEYRHRSAKKEVYYIIWAPETHPSDYRNGEFSRLYNYFRGINPGAAPIKTILYPDGQPAMRIYKLTNDRKI